MQRRECREKRRARQKELKDTVNAEGGTQGKEAMTKVGKKDR